MHDMILNINHTDEFHCCTSLFLRLSDATASNVGHSWSIKNTLTLSRHRSSRHGDEAKTTIYVEVTKAGMKMSANVDSFKDPCKGRWTLAHVSASSAD